MKAKALPTIVAGLVLLIAGGIAAFIGAAPATSHVIAEGPWGSAGYEDASLLPMVGAIIAVAGIVLVVLGFRRRAR